MTDPRIGRIHADRIEFPAVTVGGAAYERPASTLNLGDGYFVVLDIGRESDPQALDDLKALIAPKAKKAKEVSTDDAQPARGEL